MDIYLTTYPGTCNIGDIIQTIAISRLVGESISIPRNSISNFKTDGVFISNGWLRSKTEVPKRIDSIRKTIFCGIHTALWAEVIPWFSQSGVIGARDPWTHHVLEVNGIKSEFIGCATLTFERYDGHRSGIYAVETNDCGEYISHVTHSSMSLDQQWSHGNRLLEKYRTAEIVYTSRLHAALPCIAFGTPVVIRKQSNFQPDRFSILDCLGVEYDKPFVLENNTMRDIYLKFLSDKLGREIHPSVPIKPMERNGKGQ